MFHYIIGRFLSPTLIILGLPFAALAAHLETPTSAAAHDLYNEHLLEASSATAHVDPLGGGDWEAKFKVELWSARLNTSSTFVLVIDKQGCQISPLNAESEGAFLELPLPTHASVAFEVVAE